MARPRLALEIFVVALAALLLEVSYTRVFSYKLVYFFTYVVIGLALLGLGSGGVLVTLARSEGRLAIERLLPRLCLAGATTVALGYLVVATVQVNAFDIIRHAGTPTFRIAILEVLKLIVVSAALFVPFLCAGIVIAAIFAAQPQHIGRLYFADLLGAGVGCAACVPLMVALSPPGCVMLAGALFALAGIRHARTTSRGLAALLAGTAVACLAAGLFGEGRLPEIITDGVKRMHPTNRPPVLFSQWSPVFRVDVLDSPLFRHIGHALIHDGAVGSILPNVGADPGLMTSFYEKDSRVLPLAVVESEPTVTIIGSAGGSEILTARHLGAARVTGVELNPVTISLLTTHFRDFTGRIPDDPRIRLVNAEGRAYFDGTTERSDLIWFVAPDSYAAMNAATSGAYVLSESYLYTVEMLETALAHLQPGGIVCAQFGEINYADKPNRTTRYLTTAREAFRRVGVTDFSRHVLVATTPGYLFTTSTILLRREPFEPVHAERLAARAAAIGSEVRFAGRPTEPDHPVTAAITLEPAELERWYATYPWSVRPITDDAPFFWHFIGFRAAFRSALFPGPSATEEGLGERLLLVLLALVTVFATVALLVPLVVRRALWRTIPHKLEAGIYFAALGLGFMFLEVTLIQRLTLFLGYPTYALTVTLFALLVSTGVGSLVSERAVATRDRTVLRVGIALVVLVALYIFALGPLTAAMGGAPFALRVVIAVLVLLPLGLCLGAFMPLGLRSVAALTPHADAYVAWAWAVNGFCSVIASVLATMLSMSFGFRAVMVLAVAIYGVAIVALRRIPARA